MVDAHATVRLAESWEAPAETWVNEIWSDAGAVIPNGGAIPNGSGQLTFTFEIGAAQAAQLETVEHAELLHDFKHACVNDLVLEPSSPGCTHSLLIDRSGRPSINIVGLYSNF